MSYVPLEKRVFPNAFIWLTLIPGVGFIFKWLMLPFGIPHGLKNATMDNAIAVADAGVLKKLGFALMVLSTLSVCFSIAMMMQGSKHFSPIGLVVAVPTFVLWIIYWTQVVNFRRRYLENQRRVN